ncbi:hypothetical protein [Luteimonas aquatica]|uniref:hypothetical protein n=1 Tax=Luteimonas aquatica TaxID=450364 RepID=UPI001F591956|nr:hypothetical protein [Luteimonas aquatica]
MRHAFALLIALAAAGCGTVQYEDTNAAVDANPLCTSQPDRPGEPVSRNCERRATGTWKSGSEESKPLDLSGTKKDD